MTSALSNLFQIPVHIFQQYLHIVLRYLIIMVQCHGTADLTLRSVAFCLLGTLLLFSNHSRLVPPPPNDFTVLHVGYQIKDRAAT
jgi:hypothetical protein